MEVAGFVLGLGAVITAVKEVGVQMYRFSTARHAVDKHQERLRRAESKLAYWKSIADDLVGSTSIPPTRLQALKEDVKLSEKLLKEYREAVEGWTRRLSVKLTESSFFVELSPTSGDTSTHWFSSEPDTVFDDEDGENEEESGLMTEGGKRTKKRRLEGQGKKLAFAGRTGFIVVGDTKISRKAEAMKSQQKELSAKCLAESSRAESIRIPQNLKSIGRESRLMQFLAFAKDRVRLNMPIVTIDVGYPDSKYEYTEMYLVDQRMRGTPLREYAFTRATLVPKPGVEEAAEMPKYRDCIVIHRVEELAISWKRYREEALKLARLFAEDTSHSTGFMARRPEGDVLRCCAMVTTPDRGSDLLFRLPPGSNVFPRTLRQVLTDERSASPVHSLAERVNFAIRIVAGLLVVHSLGLVHKRVHPETIVVVEPLSGSERDVFPHRLGHPYLSSLQLARTDDGITRMDPYQEAIDRRGIYLHPRDQRADANDHDKRFDVYRMRDDIFSLGVCLFEVALWKSLLVWDEDVGDYVHDNDFVPLADHLDSWNGLTDKQRAGRKSDLLIEVVRERVPPVFGAMFADVIVSCLRAGFEEEAFGVSLQSKSETEVSLFFLSKALTSLWACFREQKKKLGVK